MRYLQDALDDAKDFFQNFETEVIDQLIEKGEVSGDYFGDYEGGDSYFHENYVDKWYSRREAVDLLEELSQFEETDSGIWEGLDLDRQLSAMAAYTYGNAVSCFIREFAEKLSNIDLDDLIEEGESDVPDSVMRERLAEAIREVLC